MTALTPSSAVPFAAQSRDEPEPYSLPERMTSGVPAARYFSLASKIVVTGRYSSAPVSAVMSTVKPPSVPGASWLRRRMFANVPRIITSWLPRRDP